MNIFSTLRARLLGTYLGVLILGLGGLTIFAGRQIESKIYSDFISGQKVQAYLIASATGAQIGEEIEYGNAQSIMQNFRQSLSGANGEQASGARIALLRSSGSILADDPTEPIGQICANRPEFSAAIASPVTLPDAAAEILAAKNSPEFYSVARMLVDEDESEYEHSAVVCLASSTDAPGDEVRQQWAMLWGGFGLVTTVGTLLSLWLLSTLTRPLSALRNTALRMADGELDQRVAVSTQDELGQVGQAFNEMAAQVESMVAEQRAFAANASHELRTPLTTIRLRTEALQTGQLDGAKSQQYINEIEHETQRMGGLVSDLILLSRLDAQQLAVGQEELQIDRIVQSVANELVDVAENKSVTLTVERPTERIPTITATTSHVQVVIRNLIDNAIKYTPEGGKVTASVQKSGAQVELIVEDNGVGIAPEEMPRLTERFYRADKAHSRETEGVGLGLPLVKSIVELYAGSLDLESRGLGHGTKVTVRLPSTKVTADLY